MNATAAGIHEQTAVGERFLDALTRRDWVGLASCFDEGVRFRALIPPGSREANDSTAATGYLSKWFGDATELVLVSSELHSVQDRLSIGYRFRVREDQWYIVEQRAYCDVAHGRITRMELLCSGFRPEDLS